MNSMKSLAKKFQRLKSVGKLQSGIRLRNTRNKTQPLREEAQREAGFSEVINELLEDFQPKQSKSKRKILLLRPQQSDQDDDNELNELLSSYQCLDTRSDLRNP